MHRHSSLDRRDFLRTSVAGAATLTNGCVESDCAGSIDIPE